MALVISPKILYLEGVILYMGVLETPLDVKDQVGMRRKNGSTKISPLQRFGKLKRETDRPVEMDSLRRFKCPS